MKDGNQEMISAKYIELENSSLDAQNEVAQLKQIIDHEKQKNKKLQHDFDQLVLTF